MTYPLFAIAVVLGLWLPCQVMAQGIDVFVGYADNFRPSLLFPAPWLGDPGVLDVGNAAGQIFDAGAIRIDNNTGAPLTVDNVTVDGFGSGRSFSLWGAFTIPSGMKAILTQTALPNFDTSDETLPGHECCTPLGTGVEPFPKVHITIGGQTTTLGDSAHVLDTGGFDLADLPPGDTNEASQWRLIGTTGGQASVPQPPALTFHDFNGDGKADLVWRNSDTSVALWLLDGAGLLGADFVSPAVDPDWQLVGGGDVDGDGKADLVWRHTQTGQVAVWLLDGLTLRGAAVVGAPVDRDWQIVSIADVDGDGKADLVWRQTPSGQIAVWLLSGSTLTGAALVGAPLDFDWQLVGASDVNGDKKADLVWYHTPTGQVAMWLLDGPTLLGAALVGAPMDRAWLPVGVSDVDGDGKADLVWRQTPSGQVAVWLLNSSTVVGAGLVGAPLGFDWQIVGLGDVNGDKKDDLVWRHTLTGQVAVWLLSGPTLTGAALVGAPLGSDWELR